MNAVPTRSRGRQRTAGSAGSWEDCHEASTITNHEEPDVAVPRRPDRAIGAGRAVPSAKSAGSASGGGLTRLTVRDLWSHTCWSGHCFAVSAMIADRTWAVIDDDDDDDDVVAKYCSARPSWGRRRNVPTRAAATAHTRRPTHDHRGALMAMKPGAARLAQRRQEECRNDYAKAS